MSYELLRVSLLSDLQEVGCPTNFELVIKDYSKTMYGCYRPNTNRVYLYYYQDEGKTTPYSYSHLLDKAIHEAVHAQQWSDPDFVRHYGVMHDEGFYALYRKYTDRAKELRKHEEDNQNHASNVEGIFNLPVRSIKSSPVRADTGIASRPVGRVLRVACRRRV